MSFKKMFKKVAGAISPAYGMATGEGAMGKASRKGAFGAAARAITKAATKPENKAKLEKAARKAPVLAGARKAPVLAGRMFGGRRSGSASFAGAPGTLSEEEEKALEEAARKAMPGLKGSMTMAKMARGGEVLTAEQKRMLKKVQDKKDAEKQEKAYDASLTSPEMVSPKKAPVKKAMGGMMSKQGYAAGGVVKARGMGAATRGGKCKMS